MNNLFLVLNIVYLVLVFVPPAYAYLDPGTGNALIAILMSIIGVVFFVVQGLYYRLIGKKQESVCKSNSKGLVIFSEGKNYWLTWKPIVEKLLERGQNFTYYTIDLYDPCLDIVNPLIDNRYIGSGSIAYLRLNKLKAQILLSTSPNIGTDGYPVKKSPYVKNLTHIYHAPGEGAYYHRGGLNNYDTVLLAGEYQIESLRKLEVMRGLKPKTFVAAGLPYLDEMAKELKNFKTVSNAENSNGKKTILIAPSWGNKNCLTLYGLDFIKKLAVTAYNIIIRPHPHSMKVEKELILRYQEDLSSFKNISWDFEVDGSVSLASADIMISDNSGIRVEFVFLYQKPVITLETPLVDCDEYELADLGHAWTDDVSDEIGIYVPKEKIDDIVTFVQQALASGSREHLIAFREKNLYNFGNSAEVIANYLMEQLNEKAR